MDNIIEKVLSEMEFDYEKTETESVKSYFLNIDINNTINRCVIGVNYETDETLIYVQLPSTIPSNKMSKISEFINRINLNDTLGGFTLDYADKIMGYQSYFYFEGISNDNYEQFLKVHLHHIYHKIEYYLDGLLECRYSEKEASEIINQIECKTNPNYN